VVTANADTHAGMPLGAALADDDVTGDHSLTAELLHAKALGAGIATVLDGTLSFLMGHKSRGVRGLDANGGDLKLRQVATEALGLVEALAALEFEGNALLAAELFDHLGGDGNAGHGRSTDLERIALAAKQNVKCKFGIDFGVELLNVDFVALLDAVLFTAGFDHCVSHGRIGKRVAAFSGGRREQHGAWRAAREIFLESTPSVDSAFRSIVIEIAPTAADMEALGQSAAARTEPGTVFALVGDLGAGKTHWTKGFARGLGFTGEVTSPTFSLAHEYRGGRLPIFHFDFYRIETAEELFAMGWDEYLDEGGIIVAEWAGKFPESIPPGTQWLDFRLLPDGTREIDWR
jgi:tRNA threonylcarbamoyladenosine biosynthesis protein TsaE